MSANSGLDLSKIREEQEKLSKRTSEGGKLWIQISKIKAPIDLRILDPLPSMDGLYYVEVPVHWINGKRLISHKIFGQNEVDIVEQRLEEARALAKTDKTMAGLLNKTNEHKMPIIQFKWEYWVPVLHFDWKLVGNQITDIYDLNNQYDVDLIRKFISENSVKMLVANTTTIKAINTILTTRGNDKLLDSKLGGNIQLAKTGEGRDTKYTVIATEKMPMPAEFYTEEKMTDPFEIAQSLMYTNEYMEAVVCNYLYGDCEIPAESESNYLNPEIREKLKSKFKDVPAEAKEAPRQRPGSLPSTPAPSAPQPETGPITTARTRPTVSAPVPGTPAASAPSPVTPAPVTSRRGRPGRSIVDDLKDTE